MSLLMEALRKAEEAKSKAAQEEKDKASSGKAKMNAGDFTEKAAAPESGPAVINPDPDEEETLASHAAEKALELVEMEQEPPEPDTDEDEFEQFEFTSTPYQEDDAPETTGANISAEPEDEDDGLSLLQSSYFSRTQNTGSSFVDDDFDDMEPDEPEDTGMDDDDVPSLSRQEPVAETPPEPEDDAPSAVDDAAASQAASAADRKTREKAQRDSAGALFLAKEDSRKRRLKKLMPIAAAAVVVPLAGIVIWLFMSLGADSGMQFNVPAGGSLANRSFSDTVAQQEAVAADAAVSTTDTVQAGDTESVAPAGDSTAAQQLALADNTGTDQQTPQPPNQAQTPPPLPGDAPARTAVANQAPPIPQPPQPAANPAPQVTANTTAEPAQSTPITAGTSTNTAPTQPRDTGLSFTRTEQELAINPDLVAAYESYQQADYATAGRLYQQVLAVEPNNRDALIHLASVHLKQGSPAMARSLYNRLLELNPRDPLARAGLLETVQGDTVRQETELKSLISAWPGTPQLSFALGNLYAKQNRWSEAQSAYFDALLAAKANNSGPVSPDYAFNLAVSLERINQLRAALEYYREAESLSRNTRPGFDPALLDQRLTYLEQRLR